MALQIAKQGEAAKDALTPTEGMSTAVKVDELGAKRAEIAKLQEELAQSKKAQRIAELSAEAETLENEVRDALALDLDDDETRVVKGVHYRATLGKRSNKREITDMQAAIDALGDDAIHVVTIKLGDLDKYVGTAKQESFVKQSRTGSRSFKLEPRG